MGAVLSGEDDKQPGLESERRWMLHHPMAMNGAADGLRQQQEKIRQLPPNIRPRLFLHSSALSDSFVENPKKNASERHTRQRGLVRSKYLPKSKNGNGGYASQAGRYAGKPLPRLPLTISNYRPMERWNIDNSRTASMFLSGEARTSDWTASEDTLTTIEGNTIHSSDGVLYSPGFPTEPAEPPGADSAVIKHAGIQCDMMSEIVLKFNKTTLQGAVELSRLDDVLRHFTAVARPVEAIKSRVAEEPRENFSNARFFTKQLQSESDGSSTLQNSYIGSWQKKVPHTGASEASCHRTDSVRDHALSYQTSEKGALNNLNEALDWPDRSSYSPLASSSIFPECVSDRTELANGGSKSSWDIKKESAQKLSTFDSAQHQPKVPPIDYLLDVTENLEVTEKSNERLLERALTVAVRGEPGGNDSRAATPPETVVLEGENQAPDFATEKTPAQVDVSTLSTEIDKTPTNWHEGLMAGFGLGYRMPWRSLSHGNDQSNIVIPRPRIVTQGVASISSSECSGNSGTDGPDVIDIRL